MGHPQRTLFLQGVMVAALCTAGWGGAAWGAGEAELQQLMETIRKQQEQIEAQSKALEKLRQKVETLSRETRETRETAEKAATPEKPGGLEKVVTSAGDKVKVDVYGQVNRAVLYSDDGNRDEWYLVDNDNSSTRLGLNAKAGASDDLTAGGRVEVEFQSNDSNLVNQFDKSGVGDNNFRKRWLDFSLESKRFGSLFVGHGDTASNNTSETDLSGTGVVGYSSIADMAGGQIFYNDHTRSYDLTGGDPSTGTTVGDVFDNLDGLSRNDRVRYDTPRFYGFSGAVSAVADDAYDASLWYSGQWAGVKLAAAASYVKPNDLKPATDDQSSGSISALHPSGLNLTLSGGVRSFRVESGSPGRDDAAFWYTKLGYRKGFFDIGETRFSAEYGEYDDMAQNDDEATVYGLQAVQVIDRWGTEYYLGYRLHELERDAAEVDFEKIDSVMTGFRIKF